MPKGEEYRAYSHNQGPEFQAALDAIKDRMACTQAQLALLRGWKPTNFDTGWLGSCLILPD